MSWIVESFFLLGIVMFIHVGAMALAAQAAGITVRQVTFGAGPTLWAKGKLRLALLPISGFVRMKDSRWDLLSESDLAGAFDLAPAWKQIAIPVAGLAAIFLLTLTTLGPTGAEAFTGGFRQIVLGALSPLTEAQAYLQSGRDFAAAHSPAAFAGLLAAKVAAMNLLPFSGLNGLHILTTLVCGGPPPAQWESRLHRVLIVPMLILFGGWLVALGHYFLLA